MGLGSGIRKNPIPDPRVKKALDPGSARLQKISIMSCRVGSKFGSIC